MPWLRGDVAGQAVGERRRARDVQREHSGAREIAVEHDRDAVDAGPEARGGHRRQFRSSHLAHDLDRIVDAGHTRAGRLDRGALARQAVVVDPGSATHPESRITTEERGGQRGGDRGVSDTQLSEYEQVGAALGRRIDGIDRNVDRCSETLG